MSYAQEYSFENIINKSSEKLETIQLKGQVTLTEKQILITTNNGTKQLDILGKIPYYLQRKTIYRCQDENDNVIRVLWIWTEQEKKSMDIILNDTYYTFYLTHKKTP
jgi:hypothetical protein